VPYLSDGSGFIVGSVIAFMTILGVFARSALKTQPFQLRSSVACLTILPLSGACDRSTSKSSG
jgi:hypothetical protein